MVNLTLGWGQGRGTIIDRWTGEGGHLPPAREDPSAQVHGTDGRPPKIRRQACGVTTIKSCDVRYARSTDFWCFPITGVCLDAQDGQVLVGGMAVASASDPSSSWQPRRTEGFGGRGL